MSSDDDVELRRIRISNRSSVRRTLDITSYAEIVLAPGATDSAHPAFEKLFVETEILGQSQAIVCTRRARAPSEPAPSMFHLLATQQRQGEAVSYETDRARFIGRGRSTADPQALDRNAVLSGSAGSVLDPVAAIRCCIRLDPGEAATVDLVTGVASTHEACTDLVRKYQQQTMADRVVGSASTYSQAVLSGLRSSDADGLFYANLAASVLYANAWLRADPSVLASNRQGQAGLWRYAISGDLSIVLLGIADPANLESARRLVLAHAYWRHFGLEVDLVILTAERDVDGPDLHPQINALIAACGQAERIDKPGGIFVRKLDQVAPADRILLQAVARVAVNDDDGPLARQLERRGLKPPFGSIPAVARGNAGQTRARFELSHGPLKPQLVLGNGLGGFTPDGREYVITIAAGQMTPVPWVNVLANPFFGTLVSESGSANTWSENAQEFRLTPWSNDPVGDANTEAFYLRDEASGSYWSPTLLPSAGSMPYLTRHGFGYSVFEHSENGIDSELTVFVAIDAPVKFMVLKLCNQSGRERSLSATAYLEWVLGDERTKTAMHVSTEIDAGSGALFAQNPFNTDFAGRTAFFDVDGAQLPGTSVCGDRSAFLGHHGTLRHPAAMGAPRFCGAVGSALDPCGAIRVPFTLAAGQKHELVFRLGTGATREEASALVKRWRGPTAAREARAEVTRYWTHTLGAVQVETPDRSLDVLLNGWLLYQTLACRLWARNAFYQSSGAFGFRDQLQDVMALVHAAPTLVREHLLCCASRQFPQGDVQHWWHPPSGRGVRTRCSDDYLWLPLAVCRYVVVTGDTGVLDEQVNFLEGRALKDHEASYYDLPTRSDQTGSLYEHCVRAIEHGLRFGVHGLPLMGAGDWNDGMNLVGADGQGESVWVGFFLCSVLTQFGAVAQQYGDAALAQRCAVKGAALRADIEKSAWDGQWYRRGWFDDGSPLGTSANAECRIDSIAQSWAVLSGAGDPQRVRQAMDAVDAQLVHRDSALIQLLGPPFDHSDPSPGYIQGYVPGVRENGSQYTHAAVWTAMAFAALGDARRAWELFTMIDPVRHADSPQAIATYQTEPYVIASDVYALPPHTGRGGWTWYTGSAGWMSRFILESLLGLNVESNSLRFAACLPAHWDSYEVNYRYRATLYRIKVLQTTVEDDGPHLTVDGAELPGSTIPLTDDGGEHAIVVRIHKTGA
ncbi:GH36-type glycosyl hydrolase domain-containing protein [Rhodoferax sp. UBA5149]|uniref:GH36-type glycosyl hydrolase domain-containing protein n=1 Tax=Rhodoferax sp. UBA5149 TaxID=1947379 RepID=UPI0025FF49AF|nr:hypothetical protein [Rhodoferax sp. UBA5149]